MKKILLMCLSLLLFASALVSCEDWTEPESKVFLKGDGHDDAYYAALRKWKAETDYDMAWGWFGGWGANATNLKNSLRGLPDSLYLAAIWGRWRPSVLTDAMKADMEYVQRVKGTKVVCTTITGWVGVDVIGGDYQNNPQKEEYFGWKPEWDTPSGWRAADGTDERAAQEASIRKYARMLADSVYTGGYSGIDLDYEPNVGGAGCKRELSNRDNFYIFVDELGKYLGPKSGTDKLLVIDGEINAVEGRCMPYFDYFIWQAYLLRFGTQHLHQHGDPERFGIHGAGRADPQALHHGQLRTICRRGRRLLHGRHQPASGAGSLETHMGGQDLPQGRIRLLPHRIRILSVRQIGLLSVDPAGHQRRTSVRERRRGSERITE